ncbi:restriction endonuclease subunit S [Helicobacter sp. L8]|uniref:restriction endonuclease subunit S n=1 Tax=Helicobacter sp. L8 TaxID=2316078 RepID=UPI000EAEC33E|nr:restriction endonuclease subunit S [Helicobacter sp. L8]
MDFRFLAFITPPPPQWSQPLNIARLDFYSKIPFLYALFMFSSDLMRQMEEKMPKASYPSLNTEDFRNLKIPLPPLHAQEQIVSAIEYLESKIALLQAQSPNLQAQQQAILQECLGKAESN